MLWSKRGKKPFVRILEIVYSQIEEGWIEENTEVTVRTCAKRLVTKNNKEATVENDLPFLHRTTLALSQQLWPVNPNTIFVPYMHIDREYADGCLWVLYTHAHSSLHSFFKSAC